MIKITPLTVTKNLKECAAFYVEHFDFTIVFEEDWYIHLVHKETGNELSFMVPGAENQPKELREGFSGSGVIYSFEVDDAKSEFERLKKTNVIFTLELKDEPWGQRHFVLKDPAGVFIDVVQQLEQS